MTFDILILTMPTREDFFSRIYGILKPQLERDTRVLVRMCDPELTLGENRDLLRKASSADYSAFVDDDDIVEHNYVSTIKRLLDGVDYIGFNVQLYTDGIKLPRVTKHSLQFRAWGQNEEFYYRDISHINPIRRDLAILEPMEGGHGEDVRWSDRMRGKVKTEHYVNRVLYHYYFRTKKNIGGLCPKCKSKSTVMVELGTWCNGCGNLFDEHPIRKSCLWT